MESTRKTIDVVAALILDVAGRVLATQCPPHKHGGGWEFPGGKIEPGETPDAALQREIAEELGVQVSVGKMLHTVEWDYPAFHLRMYCMICHITHGELVLREHVAYRWLFADALHSISWLPADVDILPYLESYMEKL